MKYVFIMNPNSGSSRSIRKLTGKIKSAALRCGIDAEIYHTKGEGDAKRILRDFVLNTREKVKH